MRLRKRGGPSGRLDFEINIVPIIDCLTILMTFILASGAFISLGVLEMGIAGPNSAETEAKKLPEIDLNLRMIGSRDMSLTVSGKIRKTFRIERLEGRWNFEMLSKHLNELMSAYPDVKAVTLLADQEIDYQDIVLAMEATKRSHPEVLLGGF